MKHMLICLLFLLTGFAVQAQEKTFQLGLKGGLNLSYLNIHKADIPAGDLLPGVHLGFTSTYHVSGIFALQSGLFLTTKGGKFSSDSAMGFDIVKNAINKENTLTSRQIYLQLPLYALYRIQTNTGIDFLINAGVYLAEGIGGNTRLHGNILHGDAIFEDEIKEKTFSERGLKKFDYGLAAGFGIDLKEVILNLNYELGLNDIRPDGEVYFPFYNSSYKNRNFSLSLEYRF